MSCVPDAAVPDPAAGALRLADLLVAAPGGAVALCGAGLSTESGIPDYRGPNGSLRRSTPMTYQEFTGSSAARRRYWARSFLGWRALAGARPNAGHRAVTELQRAGVLSGIITQNVDGLQQDAGALDVVELHGGLDRVVCLCCGALSSRLELDARLQHANPDLTGSVGRVNPDGDAEVPQSLLDRFVVVDCLACGSGPLKPDVVFFGETVPRPRVDLCFELVDAAGALLVLGSSLTVMSGYRFVLRAARAGTPVAVVNQGVTRGDHVAALRVDAPLGTVLPLVVDALRQADRGREDAAVPVERSA